jgi:hypothetical protein
VAAELKIRSFAADSMSKPALEGEPLAVMVRLG